MSASHDELNGIAIIGAHGRLPGADDVEQFWANLVAGAESITFFSEQQLRAAGVDPSARTDAGRYVPARGVLKGIEDFDAAFFGIHAKEAEVMDPQHRIFLEACWEALERVGYAPGCITEPVGIFAGATHSTYYKNVLLPRPELRELVGEDNVMMGNEKDYLATRAAYKLNLTGPAITLNTACSSSLVAVNQACQALLTYQCDMALAGGVSITAPQERGYYFQDGSIGSPDGHTRTFDKDAGGTVFSNGVTLVVLKRLEDALRDGDQVLAVVIGSAINNDGSQRVSFGAPGVEGQAEAISLAQAAAGVSPDSITYVEAHGTATPIGDPIEVAALTKVFRRATQRRQFCGLGSVKSNIGHLDVAAGTAGVIKTALALHHKLLPPTLNYSAPNPKLELEQSPFYVNDVLRPWQVEEGMPRRAAVSSFGTGGTNAHVILEEFPSSASVAAAPSRTGHVLVLSAKTPAALDAASRNLATWLKTHPELSFADAAYTLQVGRAGFDFRRALMCHDAAEAVALLEGSDAKKVFDAKLEQSEPRVVFMFPGQGAQYINMGATLYRHEPLFREIVDRCAEVLRPLIGADLRQIIFAPAASAAEAEERLRQTQFTQPALFTIEYALARLLMSWGVKPAAMIGHSVGEYVAGCIAGVFTMEEAVALVARRAQLVQSQAPGTMLAVRLPEAQLKPLLADDVSIAAVNSPHLCVVAGSDSAISALEDRLAASGVAGKRLHTSHAFHSSMMDPVLAPFTDVLRSVPLKPGTIPFVSNVTAQWITAEESTRPEYWAAHVRQAVRFSDGVGELLKDPRCVLLEVGPGKTLAQFARQHPDKKPTHEVISTLGGEHREQEVENLLGAVAKLWLAGVDVDWRALHGAPRRRVVLPTYPFQRKRYWPDSPVNALASPTVAASAPAADQPSDGATSNIVMPSVSTPMASQQDRKNHLQNIVTALLQELSGADLQDADPNANFLELGFDSLLLTQAATLVQRKFDVQVSFRQLMEQLDSIDSLAGYLDEQLPADKFSPAPPPSAISIPAPQSGATGMAPATAVAADGVLGQLLQQHFAFMSQVLERLGPGVAAPAMPVAKAAPVAAPPPVKKERAAPTAHGPFRPLDRGSATGLSEQQQKAFDDFMARYLKRTAGSKQLAARNRTVLADPRSAAGFKQLWKEMVYPFYVDRSNGSRVWDVDGNEYVDFVMGFGASLFGHRPPFVVEAVARQLERGFEIGPIQPIVGEAAALICELTGMERAAFCNTGSEAVLAAVRVARTVTGRDKIVTFSGAYHGVFDEVLIRPLTDDPQQRAAPIAPGIPTASAAEVIVLEYGAPESLEIIRRRGAEIAAVLVEPVQGRRPDLQPREFLHELRRITTEAGSAFIFDEVVTGFRVAPGGAQEYFGVRADIASYGKVVGGGMPIGVVAGCSKFMDALDGGAWRFGDDSFPEVGVTYFAGTFVRHPLTMASAVAVLKHLKAEGPALQQRLAELAGQTIRRIKALIERYRIPVSVAGFSSLMQIAVAPSFKQGSLLFYLLRENGIHIWENRGFIFTTAHTEADIDLLVAAFERSFSWFADNGFIAKPETPGPSNGGGQVAEFPLTPSQQEIWLASSLDERAARSYTIALKLHLRGALDRGALEESLQELVNRHDSLRTAFDPEHPVQRVLPSAKLDYVYDDLSASAAQERQRALTALTSEQAQTSFALASAPLMKARLLQLGAAEHVLIVSYSHLVVDGWSFGVLFHELSTLYAAKTGKAHGDLERALQFSEYRQLLDGPERKAAVARAEAYWKEKFSVPPPALDLPTDRPRPARRDFAASRVTVEWSPEFTQALKKASARQGATLPNYLLGCFKVLLHRLSGQGDVVVGVPAAGQIAAELQHVKGSQALVGHCVSMLPVRNSYTAATKFKEFLKEVKRATLDAFEHQALTSGRIIELLNLPRDPSRPPLVSVVFNVDRATAGFQLAGLEIGLEEIPRPHLFFDMALNVVDDDKKLVLDCDFNSSLFDADTVERWMTSLRVLVEATVANPDAGLAELPLLSIAERDLVVGRWNATSAPDLPLHIPLPQMFEAQAERTPNLAAVASADRTLTYGQLNERANQLAHYLRGRGVTMEARVAICLDRSVEMIVAVLGVLKAGAAYVPLDPAYPAERLAFMLEDAAAKVVITQRSLLAAIPANTDCVMLDADLPELAAASVRNLSPQAQPGSLAYIIYTSGSTGRPKGVLVEHRGLSNLVLAQSQAFGLRAGRQVLQFASFSFDAAISEIGMALTTGATLHMVDRDTLMSLDGLTRTLKAKAIDVVTLPPSLLALLDPQQLPSLRTIVSAGEACPWETALRWSAGRDFFNAYGPTECTVGPTYQRVVERVVGARTVPIGRPIANMQVYILDDRQQPLPIGVPGEICIGGVGVARGYLDRPELTNEKFIANPFVAGARIYRTGDLARFLQDGSIEYLGRIDQQVKVRGYRIELGEIEARLAEHPQISDAVVVARTEGNDTTLAAYAIAKGEPPSSEDLRRFLSAKLPAFMMPTSFAWLPEFPLTPNGKVDRRALPALAEATSGPQTVATPANELEGALLEIWTEVLGRVPADINQSFFDLGGHSLLAMRVLTQVNDLYGVEIRLGTFLQGPTVPALAIEIEQALTEQISRMDSEEVQKLIAEGDAQRVEAQ